MDKNHDYTSRVPKYIFPDTLEEQQKQLKSNPLLQRFTDSRKSMENDRFRPVYHYVNPENLLNDPNGLCFWKGRWHLFYQAYPPEDPRLHWGHAVSHDLIHWHDLPYAIYPNPEECCFSGSAFVEEDRVIAMYHGTRIGNMVAVSSDPLLLNFEKISDKAVIPMESSDGSPLPYFVFDPCIWKNDGIYYSLSGGTIPHASSGRRIRTEFLFRSKDLISWEYLHPFIENDVFATTGDDGACPYFWPIGDRYILLHFSHTSGAKFMLGEYDTKHNKFIVSNGGNFTFGASHSGNVHAPSAFPDGRGSVIAIFNMGSSKPAAGWNGLMTLPRRLSLIDKDELAIEPAGDIESLRYNHQHLDSMTLLPNKEIVLEDVQGNAMEIIAEIDPKDAPMIEMNVLRSTNKEEYTRIAFFKQRGCFNYDKFNGCWEGKEYFSACNSIITIDSSYSSEDSDVSSRPPETAPVFIKDSETLKLRIFIDKSVVEVFVNGRQCLAVRVYPGKKDSVGVSLRSQGQESELVSFDAWQMKNIYENIGEDDYF